MSETVQGEMMQERKSSKVEAVIAITILTIVMFDFLKKSLPTFPPTMRFHIATAGLYALSVSCDQMKRRAGLSAADQSTGDRSP